MAYSDHPSPSTSYPPTGVASHSPDPRASISSFDSTTLPLSPEPVFAPALSLSTSRRRPKWFARTSTWVALSGMLFALLVVLGGSTAHPAVREYVGGKVDSVTGLKASAVTDVEGKMKEQLLEEEKKKVEEMRVRLDEAEARVQAAQAQVAVVGEEKEWTQEQFWDDVRAGKKANGTLILLISPRTNPYKDLLPTLHNIENRFNRRLGYPIQLLTDGALPAPEIMERTAYITGGKAKWDLVTPEQGWGPPSWVSKKDVAKGQKAIKGFPIGYRNMCRFFSKFHHLHPTLINYEYIWRLDEGIEFFCDLMQSTSSLYGFSNLDTEALFVVPTLWQRTQEFMEKAKEKHPDWFPEGRDEGFLLNKDGEWNRIMYYNNFEIVHRSFLESEPYQAYVSYLDELKGFYLERWGDAPVRTIGLNYFVDKAKIHDFAEVTGYMHPNPPFYCPDKPWCSCNPAKSKDNAFEEWYRR
ncbi:hypothetical protein JCM6882_003737 [Rhodosporidiobolus microsporus]